MSYLVSRYLDVLMNENGNILINAKVLEFSFLFEMYTKLRL